MTINQPIDKQQLWQASQQMFAESPVFKIREPDWNRQNYQIVIERLRNSLVGNDINPQELNKKLLAIKQKNFWQKTTQMGTPWAGGRPW